MLFRSNRSQFAGRPGFLGAWSPQEIADPGLAGSFTTIFMVEVIEHLSDEHLAAAMVTIKRLLAPGGRLVCTTPNDEDLEAARKAISDCVRASCGVPVAEAITVQARHSAAFMVTNWCKRGRVGGEYAKTMAL